MEDAGRMDYRMGKSRTVLSEYRLIEPSEGQHAEFNIEVRFAPVPDREMIGILVTISISLQDDSGRSVTPLRFSQAYDFLVRGWESLERKADTIGFPKALAGLLTNIAVGATRGLLLERMRGTPLEQLIMPIVDINALLPESEGDTVFLKETPVAE